MEYLKKVRVILSNRKLSIGQQIDGIKQTINAGDYKEALKMHPGFNKFLLKAPFFKTIADIHIKETFQFTSDFKKEYKWLTNILENYLDEINEFIGQKNSFENLFLLKKIPQAIDLLSKIENKFGISLWSIEANLMIEEYLHGPDANWNKMSIYLSEIKNPFYDFIINSSSKRIEAKLSYDSYLNQFQNDLDNINADGVIKDFFVFKNFSYAHYDYEFATLASVLYVSNIFSVIDQYLILIDVIVFNISNSAIDDKLFYPFIRNAKEKITSDSTLANIYNIINERNEFIRLKNNVIVYECLNSYYNGHFQESLELSKKGIEKCPTEFEFYEIYCKSLINLKNDFQPLGLSSLIDNLLQELFNLLTFRKQKDDSFKKIMKTSLLFMNSNFGKQSYALLAEIEANFERSFSTGILSATFNSYKNIFLSKKRKSIPSNFNQLQNEHSYNVFSFKIGNDVHFNGEISTSISQSTIFKAMHLYNCGDFKGVIKILNDSSYLDDTSYYLERKLSLLFNSYLYLNLFKDALKLYGAVFFDDILMTRKLNELDLFYKIRETEIKDDFISCIELPILYSLIVKEYDLYEVFDDFMYSFNVSHIRLLDIEQFIATYNLNKVIYFLHNCATIDTLKYSTDYGSISEVEEDRVYILNELIRIDNVNKLKYQREVDEIYRVNSVRRVLKEVDEGRLYIDVNNLKAIQIKKFKDDFTRYKEIEISSSNKTLIGFNSSSTKDWDKALTEKTTAVDEYNSADYLAFKSIYLESKNDFLFSKEYGLDSCLSTRIRHGALKNHIRSVFEKLDLVTSKSNEKYKDNDIWQKQLYYHQDLIPPLQNRLKQFSKDIDDYTVFVVEKQIQIQTEKTQDKKDGLFQYFTSDELLYKFYYEQKSYWSSIESTIDIILNDFVNYTLLQVQKSILDAFSEGISKEFQSIIDGAIVDLRDLGLPPDCQLLPNLTKSSTEIQKELEYLSSWFFLNTTSSSSLLNLETILNASIDLTNKINPLFNLKPTITIKEDVLGYSNLIFVFNILLYNVIQHSNLENDKIDLNIIVEKDENGDYIVVKFKNNLNPKGDFSANKIKLEKVKNNWNDHSNIDRSNKEGESGYDKIKRILIYEALAKTDLFDFEICNNEITISLYFPYKKPLSNE